MDAFKTVGEHLVGIKIRQEVDILDSRFRVFAGRGHREEHTDRLVDVYNLLTVDVVDLQAHKLRFRLGFVQGNDAGIVHVILRHGKRAARGDHRVERRERRVGVNHEVRIDELVVVKLIEEADAILEARPQHLRRGGDHFFRHLRFVNKREDEGQGLRRVVRAGQANGVHFHTRPVDVPGLCVVHELFVIFNAHVIEAGFVHFKRNALRIQPILADEIGVAADH
ncbi:hypothetical protein SDC9_170029 [bioreactor metagenome]|uniref:Uncharacterized protein n=1 Tax=bioreactor metagenome TaxID=1076179 RepID=A0A645G957_9ZZZZ